MAARTKLNHSGMAALLKSNEVRSMLDGPAARVLSAAQASAPVKTGAYRDSLHVEDDTTDRAVKRIASGVSYGMAVEARTGHLARAIGSA